MGDTKKKTIYLGKSIEDLNAQIETKLCSSLALQNTPAKTLLSSGTKVVTEAGKMFSAGDEELAYVLYMRAATMYTAIKKAKGYSASDPRFLDAMYKTNLVDAICKSETLAKSLEKRYALLKLAADSDATLQKEELKDAQLQQSLKKGKKSATPPHINGVVKSKVEEEESNKTQNVSVAQLKNLLEQQSTTLLVIDCRGAHDFNRGHFIHPNCISIPQELLEPGMSAFKIEAKLKEKQPESYHSWNKRGSYDRVILYDWNSSWENMQGSLSTLFAAMTKWDHETVYKSPPTILQGGIRNLYYSYPTLINHPQNTSSDLDKLEESGGKSTVNGTGASLSSKLNSISYPSWDDEGQNVVTTTTRPSSTPTPKYSGSNNSIPQPPSSATIDRSNKPKTTPFTNGGTKLPPPMPNPTIVPVHNGPKKSVESKVNGVGHGDTSSYQERTAEALNAVLDSVITSSKELKAKEEEFDGILQSSGESDALKVKVAQKEAEIAELQSQVKRLDSSLASAKAEYDALSAAKVRPSLPVIRPSATDSGLDSKFREKSQLEDYVKQIRAKRKALEEERLKAKDKLATIPDSGSSSPRTSRGRVTNGPSTPAESTSNPKMTQSAGPGGPASLIRPMSQDATPISYQRLRDEPSSESPRSLLKRSHSHPNIAQSLSEEDSFQPDGGVGPSPLPQFNRNLKPSGSSGGGGSEFPVIIPSRARQFHAVNSTEKHRTGLKNLGNTCYMNSIVQCLLHLPGLVEYFNGEKWKNDLRLFRSQKHKQICNGEVSLEFHAVVQEMNIGHRSIAIMDFKNNVGRHHHAFKGYDQQDSHEFLTLLLDWLHEELNTVCKMKANEQKNDGMSDDAAADQAWRDHNISNRSKIVDLFGGQQKSALRCLSCGKESVTFEYFSHLSIPIPSNNNRKVDVYQCLDLYTTEETVVGWSCPHCKSTVKATKKIDLWRLPPYLIIHLQRFYNDGSTVWWKKRLTEVDFPVDNLDLTARVKGKPYSAMQEYSNRVPRSNFMLQAVSNHYGSMDGGHYTAYCRKYGSWAKFDDQEVTSINSRDVITPAAYILFYCNNTP